MYIITYVKNRSILLFEAVFTNNISELIANGKIIKRTYAKKEALSLLGKKSNTTADSSNSSKIKQYIFHMSRDLLLHFGFHAKKSDSQISKWCKASTRRSVSL